MHDDHGVQRAMILSFFGFFGFFWLFAVASTTAFNSLQRSGFCCIDTFMPPFDGGISQFLAQRSTPGLISNHKVNPYAIG